MTSVLEESCLEHISYYLKHDSEMWIVDTYFHTCKCIRRFGGIYAYCRHFIDRKWSILVLILYKKTHAICLKDYRIRLFLSIRHAHGDLCKHLGIDSSTDLDDRYSKLFLHACINRHAHTQYLKMIEVYSPLGIWHVFLCSINTNVDHFRSMTNRQYA